MMDNHLTDMRTALVRKFESGATRSGGDKPEYIGYFCPKVYIAYGLYMFKHQMQPDGTIRDCRNWQKGIPPESYMQSLERHRVELWSLYEDFRVDLYTEDDLDLMIDALMALLFNTQGLAHELIKMKERA